MAIKCMQYVALFFLFSPLTPVLCGDLTVCFSPPSLRFGKGDSLHLSDLDDLLAASLGYTPESLTWSGMTITSAFNYPLGAVIFGIKNPGVRVKLEGISYYLKEDASFDDAYYSLTSLIGARAQRPIYFNHINGEDLVKMVDHRASVNPLKALDETEPVDSKFIEEMAALPYLTDILQESSSTLGKGQDVIFVNIDSFYGLIKEYGEESPEVEEGIKILRGALEQSIYQLRTFYKERLIVAAASVTETAHSRRIRREVTDVAAKNVTRPYNLASVYSEDFPVIFNIVLILAIILIVAIIAVALAMAYMDPGRDSIIYRMTNPRMKKDQ